MTMPEATRLQYLALLGIEQWLPRDAVESLSVIDPVVDAVAGPASPVTAAAATAAPASVSASLPPERAAQLDAMLAQSRRPPAASARIANPVVDRASAGQSSKTPAEAESTTADIPERVGCSFLPLGDGLLIVAAFATPHAPGLSGPEHALLANIAASLAPGSTLPVTIDFSWPPAGMRVPGMEKPGGARDALAAMLVEQRKRGVRDVVVLGGELAALLGDVVTRLDMVQAGGPSLAAMLADPLAKRACWEAVRSLRRAPRG